jgi:hypothetical protein
MKKSISLIVLAAGWLLTTALASGPAPSPAGLPPARLSLTTRGWLGGQSPLPPCGPSASMIPWLASVLNGDPQPLATPSGPGGANPRVVEAYGQLPLGFEANEGQTAAEVKFLARGSGYALFLTPAEAVLTLRQPRGPEAEPLRPGLAGVTHRPPASAAQAPLGPAAPPMIVHLRLVGANPHPTLEGMDELPGRVNYLRGNDPQQWRTNVPTYGKARYAQAYPGIDLVYYGNPRQLEHDFVVAPGADPSVIAMEIEGAGKACLDARGDLVWATGAGEVRLEKPRIYQEVEGRRREVAGGYVLGPGPRVGFRVGAYDARRPLVIDPVLVYATFLGGSNQDEGLGIAVDAAGNAYVTGQTYSTDFPGASNSPIQPSLHDGEDVFVAKLNASGTALVYATYLGGNSNDWGTGIAVDASGNAYVTGVANSTDFPLAGSPLQASSRGGGQAFVAKLNAAGSALAYSTYLGGTGTNFGLGIAVDAAGDAYVTGYTDSTDFPLAGSPLQSSLRGTSNAFVAKLNAEGSALAYSTYLGGSGIDVGEGIAVDAAGDAYVTGITNSSDFPLASRPIQSRFGGGSQDAFVAKLNAAGSALVYSTYLGGSGNDYALGIAVDAAGNAYVTGFTNSPDLPLAGNPLQSRYAGGVQDAFVAKLNATGSALAYSTYLGGSGEDSGSGIAVDAAGNAYVTGSTGSTDFPGASNSPIQSSHHDGGDTFVAKLNAAGSALAYSTYLGGGDSGLGIAVDTAGNAYVAGIAFSTDLPGASSSPIQPNFRGGDRDAFVAKIASDLSEVAPTANAGPDQTAPVGSLVTLDGSASSDPGGLPLTYQWAFVSKPAASTAALSDPTSVHSTFTPDAVGDYRFQLIVTNADGFSSAPAAVMVSTRNSPPVAEAGPDQAITVIGTRVQLDGSQSYDPDGQPITYQWSILSKPAGSQATLTGATTPTPSFVADVHGDYIVQLVVTDSLGLASSPSIVKVSFNNVAPVADAGLSQSAVVGQTVTLDGSKSSDANGDRLTYRWSIISAPSGSQAAIANPTAPVASFVPDLPGTFIAQLIVDDGFVDSVPATVEIEVVSRQTQLLKDLANLQTVIGRLAPKAFQHANQQRDLLKKLNEVIDKVQKQKYSDALHQLQGDLLKKVNGCAAAGAPQKDDWIVDCADQSQVYTPLLNIIAELKAFGP